MTKRELSDQRLACQQISAHWHSDAAALVAWMGAVQAQDYYGSLWAIGLRVPGLTARDVERAVAERRIVRSWPMRRTLHYVMPEDLRWMLKFLATRLISRMASTYRKLELDKATLRRSARIVEKTIGQSGPATRDEIYRALEKAGVQTRETRGLHILAYLAQTGLLCHATRRGNQPTFALLDEWIAPAPELTAEEALAKLAKLYFQSHGPAAVADLMWWSGLTKAESLRAIAANKNLLTETTCNGTSYWFVEQEKGIASRASVILLPPYDEYSVGYRDRSALVSKADLARAGKTIFSPSVFSDGKVVGSWKRTTRGGNVIEIAVSGFHKLPSRRGVEKAARAYAKFFGGTPDVVFPE